MPGNCSNPLAPTSTGHDAAQQDMILERKPVSECLDDNEKLIAEVFSGCGDLVLLPWHYGSELQQRAFSVYFDTLVQEKQMNYMKATLQDLVTHEVGQAASVTPDDVIRFFGSNGVSFKSASVLADFRKVVDHLVRGHLLIFFEGWDRAISYDASGVLHRQLSEPITEPVVQGPHISTIENIKVNIGLIRNLLKSPRLKFENRTTGAESRRSIAFGYLDGAVDPATLDEFKRRIADIDKEEIMETSYLEEWLRESAYTPFPQVRYTERPDTAAAALLDGKIIAMVEGTPTIMICPGLYVEFFMTSEDYYNQAFYSSLIRLLRVGAFFIALLLPSVYIALSTFHSELLPTVLLLTILDAREGIPFPALVEALIMEFFFELLREAGIRLPRPIGSAVSIVGALVIGQAAIQAKIASPVMVIVVALTGIASFAMPQYSMAIALRILRFPLMILAGTMGGLGVMFGLMMIFLHLVALRSLDQPYLAPLTPLRIRQLRDVFVVIPRKILLHHPRNHHLHKSKGKAEP